MLADHARTLDPFGKATEELIEALPFAEFNPHVSAITPPQGVILARGYSAEPGTTLRDNPVRSPASRPRPKAQGYRTDGILTSGVGTSFGVSGYSRSCRLAV